MLCGGECWGWELREVLRLGLGFGDGWEGRRVGLDRGGGSMSRVEMCLQRRERLGVLYDFEIRFCSRFNIDN